MKIKNGHFHTGWPLTFVAERSGLFHIRFNCLLPRPSITAPILACAMVTVLYSSDAVHSKAYNNQSCKKSYLKLKGSTVTHVDGHCHGDEQ